MSRRTPRLTASLAVAVLGVAAAAALVPTARAAATGASGILIEPSQTAAAPSGDITLTLALSPGNRAGLASLAAAGHRAGETHAAMVSALAATAPTSASRAAVVTFLTGHGLTVADDGDAWLVRATAPMAVAEAAFGVTEHSDGAYRVPDQDPYLPAGVDGVFGFDTRPTMHPQDTPVGYQPRDLKAAYSVTRPQSTGAGETVATVQFSGWDATSLTHYAGEVGTTLATNQLTEIPENGADPTAADGNGGDVEVALDQETILGQAPAANQRAYFGTNDQTGAVDVYSAIASDAATYGITTSSSSWGGCELDLPATYRNALQTQVNRVVAAGATFFSATGDAGAYDCTGDGTSHAGSLAVDFPASLPTSVGVGATTLTNPTTTPSESAWSRAASGNNAAAGTGGGVSADYAAPTYQTNIGISGKRELPDVVSDGDPNTGVDVYLASSSDATTGDGQYGGTSLSAPTWASELADALSSLGCDTGLGDIHTLLYASKSFTDITTGNNLHYNAGTGYDEASGLGSPIWNKLALDLQPTAGCSGGDYFPLTPTRILDTRNGTGASQAPIGAGATLNLTVLGAGGVPATGVSAVVLNVTAVGPTASSYLTVYPTGVAQPTASSLNTTAGVTVPNLVTVGVGAGGRVSFFNAGGSTDLLADVQGYYASGTTTTLGSRFFPITPSRLLDTRNGTGAAQAMVGAGATVSFTASGTAGIPSANLTAVVINLTAVNPSVGTYETAYADGATQPTVSNLNPTAGQTVANLAIVPVGSDGKIAIYNSSGTTDLVADAVGYFTSAAGVTGSRFASLTPTRILDTRNGTGAAQSPVASGATLALQVLGAGGVPLTTVTAVTFNITVVNPTTAGYLTVFPGSSSQPKASNLNFVAGQTLPNLVTVKVGTDGKVDIYSASGTTDLLADVVGYTFS